MEKCKHEFGEPEMVSVGVCDWCEKTDYEIEIESLKSKVMKAKKALKIISETECNGNIIGAWRGCMDKIASTSREALKHIGGK